jgi:hypothetical protein
LRAVVFEATGGRSRVKDPQPLFPLLLGSGTGIDTSRRWHDVALDGERFLVIRKAADAENDNAAVVLNWTSVLAGKERP